MKLTAVLWAAIVLAALAGAALTLVARGNLAHGDLASQLALAVSIASHATLGALIVRQTGNRIGWIMLAAGAGQAFLTIASIYAVIGIATFPGSLPAAKQVGTLAEAAVYFCTLEALQNITKYASASRATVGLSCSDGSLQFTVTDDGTGFDTATTRHGTGLPGMADRLAALGGALHVRSRPGEGTTLSGELPVSARGQVSLSQQCA